MDIKPGLSAYWCAKNAACYERMAVFYESLPGMVEQVRNVTAKGRYWRKLELQAERNAGNGKMRQRDATISQSDVQLATQPVGQEGLSTG